MTKHCVSGLSFEDLIPSLNEILKTFRNSVIRVRAEKDNWTIEVE